MVVGVSLLVHAEWQAIRSGFGQSLFLRVFDFSGVLLG
jgi:hypothetical protein